MNLHDINTDEYWAEELQRWQERRDHNHCEVCRQPLDDEGNCAKCFMDDLKELQRREE